MRVENRLVPHAKNDRFHNRLSLISKSKFYHMDGFIIDCGIDHFCCSVSAARLRDFSSDLRKI